MTVLVSKDDYLQTGDRAKLTFVAGGLFRSTKQTLIRARLSAMKEIRVETIDYTPDEMRVTVLVVQNPLPVAFLVGGIIAVAASVAVYASLVKVEKLVASPAGGLLIGGLGVVVVAIGVTLVANLVFRRSP